MTEKVDNEIISEAARTVVAVMAPQELPLFRANSEAYFKNPEKALQNRSGKDEMLGFGVGEVIAFLTPVVLAVISDVAAYLYEEVKKAAQAESAGWINATVGSMFAKLRPGQKTPAETNNKQKPARLTPEQLAQVREIVIGKASQLKLSDERAGILADTIVGGLALA